MLVVIDDAARRADQHIDPVLEVAALFLVIDTTEDHREFQPRVAGEHFGVFVDLYGEFAGRRDDERPDRGGAAGGRWRIGEQVLEDRDEERGGLAGAGLRLSSDVATGQRDRQGLRLDGCAAYETGVLDTLHEGRMEFEG